MVTSRPHPIYNWLLEKERQWWHQCLSKMFRRFQVALRAAAQRQRSALRKYAGCSTFSLGGCMLPHMPSEEKKQDVDTGLNTVDYPKNNSIKCNIATARSLLSSEHRMCYFAVYVLCVFGSYRLQASCMGSLTVKRSHKLLLENSWRGVCQLSNRG